VGSLKFWFATPVCDTRVIVRGYYSPHLRVPAAMGVQSLLMYFRKFKNIKLRGPIVGAVARFRSCKPTCYGSRNGKPRSEAFWFHISPRNIADHETKRCGGPALFGRHQKLGGVFKIEMNFARLPIGIG
jgi:hypothetical protein